MINNRKDYSSLQRNHLTAIEFVRMDYDGQIWKFQCDCGKTLETFASRVDRSIVKSCGCIRYQNKRNLSPLTPYKRIWSSNKYQAKGLSFESFMYLIKQDCHYCGEPPRTVNPYGSTYQQYKQNTKRACTEKVFNTFFVQANGIDKKIPTDNYSDFTNLVPCCKTCNWMKNVLKYEDFIKQNEKIYKYQLGQNG